MRIYREAVGKEWRKWFAWLPIRTEEFEWVWLETVERRYFNCPLPNVVPSNWIIYRRIKNFPKN